MPVYWIPTINDLPDIQFWLDIDDYSTLTLDSTAIESIADKSENGRIATAPAGEEPSYVVSAYGSKPVARFSGNQYMNFVSPYLGGNQKYSIYCVITRTAEYGANTSSDNVFWGVVGFDGSINMLVLGWRNQLIMHGHYGNDYYSTSTYPYSTPSLDQLSFVYGGVGSYGKEMFLNASSVGSTANDKGSKDGNLNSTLGRYFSQRFNGDIGELLVFSNDLSFSNNNLHKKIEGYLAWKWNIQSKLPLIHPYKNSPPER